MLSNTGTFSKNPLTWGLDEKVKVQARSGCGVKVEGRWFIDFTSSLGANLLGYTAEFEDCLIEQVRRGIDATLPWDIEEEVAELLCEVLGRNVPSWGPDEIAARFCLTGSEATTMAVRLARAYTGKNRVITLKGGYHGWLDWTVGRTPPAKGIVKDKSVIEIDDFSQLEEALSKKDIAALIFEIPVESIEGKAISDLCKKHNVLLIADEVVTGLRYSVGGGCKLYDVSPDLVCMGKGLGNGVPIGAVIGKREILELFRGKEPVFCSSTHWGNALGFAAARFVLKTWTENHVKLLWELGLRFIDIFESNGFELKGHGPRSVIKFKDHYHRKHVIRELAKSGFLVNRPNLMNYSMNFDMLDQLQAAVSMLPKEHSKEGEAPLVLFEGR